MDKSIEKMIKAAIENVDSVSIVPAEFEADLREMCTAHLARNKVEAYDDLSEIEQRKLSIKIQRRQSEVLADNPFRAMFNHSASQHVGKRFFAVLLSPTIGAVVTLAALALVSNR